MMKLVEKINHYHRLRKKSKAEAQQFVVENEHDPLFMNAIESIETLEREDRAEKKRTTARKRKRLKNRP